MNMYLHTNPCPVIVQAYENELMLNKTTDDESVSAGVYYKFKLQKTSYCLSPHIMCKYTISYINL